MAIYVIKLPDMKIDRIITEHKDTITSVAWNHFNPQQLVSAACDGEIFVWDLSSDKPIVSFTTKNIVIQCLFNPFDGNQFACLLDNGDFVLYDIRGRSSSTLTSVEAPVCFRYSFHSPNRLALACNEDGYVITYNLATKKETVLEPKDEEAKPRVSDIQWDIVSANYLLVSWVDGTMSLFDTENSTEMQTFDSQTNGISSILWIKGHPGGFMTTTEKLPAIKIWNVSNKSNLSTKKVGIAGISNCLTITSEKCPNTILISFRNGSVGFFNHSTNKINYITETAHSETVFDVQFRRDQKNIIATASYDGTIKIWDIRNMKSLKTLSPLNHNVARDQKKMKVVFALSWAPFDESNQWGVNNRLVSSNSSGELTLWDVDKGKLLSTITPHKAVPILRVAWNQINPHLIASGSDASALILCRTDGKTLAIAHVIKQDGSVQGVSWDPFSPAILASGGVDGKVRIWDFSKDTAFLINELGGHAGKVFNVEWHPTIRNIIASSGDDKTICVHDVAQNTSIVLAGHIDKTRPLVWNTELPWMLISGGWDTTVRVWDIRSQKCLVENKEHHGDIYGIALHPQRPFSFVTCSRDSTIRLWSMDSLLFPPLIELTCTNKTLDNLIGVLPGTFSELLKEQSSMSFCGQASSTLRNMLKGIKDQMVYFREIITFLTFQEGQFDFWDLINFIKNKQPGDQNNTICHVDDLRPKLLSEAQELESKDHVTYDFLHKKKDRLLDCAKIYLKLGEFELYCEVLVKVGEWEKALAIAPGAGMNYWQKLTKRYAQYLKQNSNNDNPSSAYFLALGDIESALEDALANDEYEEAKHMASAFLKGKFSRVSYEGQEQKLSQNDMQKISLDMNNTVELTSKKNIKNGHPVKAAACYLSIGNLDSAINVLAQNQEHLLAFILSKLFDKPVKEHLSQLAKKCEAMGRPDIATIINNSSQ